MESITPFRQKSVLITGASSGLGRALAIALNKRGANLLLMARDSQGLNETASHCSDLSALTVSVTGDVTNTSDCQHAVDEAIKHFNGIDYLILNAGISMWSTFDELPNLSYIQQIMDVNYHGAVNCTHFALPYLKRSQGLITVISSIQGKIGTPFHTGYAASKHALHGFFNSLRLELTGQVDILLACPGWIQGTNLKKNSLKSNQTISTQLQNKHFKEGIALQACVNAIINAMVNRDRELTLPKLYRYIPLLQVFMPKFLDRLILKKVAKDEGLRRNNLR